MPVTTIHVRRYDHERESQEREDRQEVLDRPDELPRVHSEARPIGREQEMPKRGADMKKIEKIEKGIRAFRRGGIWYDPMCFPEFGIKTDR
jgi:hypothetical protein